MPLTFWVAIGDPKRQPNWLVIWVKLRTHVINVWMELIPAMYNHHLGSTQPSVVLSPTNRIQIQPVYEGFGPTLLTYGLI